MTQPVRLSREPEVEEIDLREAPGKRTSAVVARRVIGMELARLRGKRSQRAMAADLDAAVKRHGGEGMSLAKYQYLEAGTRPLPETDLPGVLEVFGDALDDERRAYLRRVVTDANSPGWWDDYSDVVMERAARRYIGLEWGAAEIRSFDALVLHGMLQTPAYAEAVIRSAGLSPKPAELVDKLMEMRRRRWSLLAGDDPVQLTAVVDEAALRRAMGPPQVMVDQLRHIAELADLPHVTVRVIPFSAGPHAGLSGAFSLMAFERRDATMVYVEGPGQTNLLDGEKDVMRYSQAFDRLLEVSLGVAESQDLLRSVAVRSDG